MHVSDVMELTGFVSTMDPDDDNESHKVNVVRVDHLGNNENYSTLNKHATRSTNTIIMNRLCYYTNLTKLNNAFPITK